MHTGLNTDYICKTKNKNKKNFENMKIKKRKIILYNICYLITLQALLASI